MSEIVKDVMRDVCRISLAAELQKLDKLERNKIVYSPLSLEQINKLAQKINILPAEYHSILLLRYCFENTAAALFPGVGAKAAVAIAVILINSGLKQVYYEMEMYSATDDEYQYVKRIAQFYKSRGGDSIGSPIEGIQKKSLDAA